MMPGPDFVLACPDCDKPLRLITLSSGNTFGGVRWSDGYAEYPMLPRIPDISRCPHCAALFWVAEAREIGSFEFWREERSEWSDVPRLDHLDASDLEMAIESGMGKDGREFELRRMLWWAQNDGARKGGDVPTSPTFLDNLKRLRTLLDANEEDGRLLAAETHREAGEFGAALSMIGSPFSEGLQEVSCAIERAAKAGESQVFALP